MSCAGTRPLAHACAIIALLTLLPGAVSAASPARGDDDRRVRRTALEPLQDEGSLVSTAGGYSGDGGQGKQAVLGDPRGVRIDASGNVFITERTRHRIRKLAPDGTITTFAGTGRSEFAGDGGPAAQASLSFPTAMAFDTAGNLLVADSGNHRIRRITPAGQVSTFAGNGSAASAGDGGQATAASLNNPWAVAVDASGNVYVGEYSGHRVRRIAVDGTISTVAGTGIASRTGDGGPGTSATLNMPASLAVGSTGELFIADSGNHVVRKLEVGGNISTVMGTGAQGCGTSGNPLAISMLAPHGLDVDASGKLFVSEACGRIISLTQGGIVDLHIGFDTNTWGPYGDGGPASQGSANFPNGLDVDAQGNVYFADAADNRVRRIEAGTTILGTLAGGLHTGDGGPAVGAALTTPPGVALAPDGTIYVAETGLNRIRRISPAGVISTVAGTGFPGDCDNGVATECAIDSPIAVAIMPDGNLLIADRTYGKVRMVANGLMFTVAGGGVLQTENIPATQAQLTSMRAIAVAGNQIYVISRHRVRRFTVGGTISTVAGTATAGFNGDGIPGTSAQLNGPQGLALDAAGDVYIADTGNHRVRKVSAGLIQTLAGTGTAGFSGDGSAATAAQINAPRGLAVHPSGMVYVSDTSNHRVRGFMPGGDIDTVAGTGIAGFNVASGTATSVALDLPYGLAFGPDQGLLISDYGNGRVRRLQLPGGGVPEPPRMGGASAGIGQATVHFSPPLLAPGTPITGYTVSSIPAGGVDAQAGSDSLAHVVSNLAVGVTYQFTVVATNAAGTSPPSALSNAVTPMARALSIADVTVAEGHSGGKIARFTVSLTSAAPSDVGVVVATEAGTAMPGEDFAALDQPVTIPAGETSATVDVVVSGDTDVEGDETFVVALRDATGAVLGRDRAIGTIGNDDSATLSLEGASISEGDTGNRTAVVTLRLSAPQSTPVTVDLATSAGTATAGVDFTPRALQARVIDAGRTTATFEVAITGDDVDEADETFTVAASNPTGASLGQAIATVTVLDDDGSAATIAEVQGLGPTSSLLGKDVDVEGVVVAVLADGFALQSAPADNDGDPATSEGLFVLHDGASPERGDRVRVSGRVGESAGRSSQTQLSARRVEVLARQLTLPAAVSLDAGTAGPGARARLESLEGMRVFAPVLAVVGPTDDGNARTYAVVPGVPRPFLPAASGAPPAERLRVDSLAQRGGVPNVADAGGVLVGPAGVLADVDGGYAILTDPATPGQVTGTPVPVASAAPASGTGLLLWPGDPSRSNLHPQLAHAKAANQLCAFSASPAAVVLLDPMPVESAAALRDAVNAGAGNTLFPGACPDSANYQLVASAGLLVDATAAAGVRRGVRLLGGNEQLRYPDGSRGPVHEHAPSLFELPTSRGEPVAVLVVRLSRAGGDTKRSGLRGHRSGTELLRSRRLVQARSASRLAAQYGSGRPLLVVVAGLDGAEDSPEARAIAGRSRAGALRSLYAALPAGDRYNALDHGLARIADQVYANAWANGKAQIELLRLNADYAEDHREDAGVPMRVSDRDPILLRVPF